jgi:hypothetical protein
MLRSSLNSLIDDCAFRYKPEWRARCESNMRAALHHLSAKGAARYCVLFLIDRDKVVVSEEAQSLASVIYRMSST